jgi:hypothetical protein
MNKTDEKNIMEEADAKHRHDKAKEKFKAFQDNEFMKMQLDDMIKVFYHSLPVIKSEFHRVKFVKSWYQKSENSSSLLQIKSSTRRSYSTFPLLIFSMYQYSHSSFPDDFLPGFEEIQ